MVLSIKMEPELRHVLAHMTYAIESLVKGEHAEAQYEIEEIKSAIFWDSDGGQTADAKEWFAQEIGTEDGKMHEEDKTPQLQGQGRKEEL